MAQTTHEEGVHDEVAFAEVEKVLLYVSDARERARRAAIELERLGAEEHLIAAVRAAAEALEDDHRKLMQGTYFAVPSTQLSL